MDFFFFFFLQWLLDPKGCGSPNFLISSRSESSLTDSCELHPLVQQTSPSSQHLLFNLLSRSFLNVSFSDSEVFVIDGWWISGYRKVMVTCVRGDQIKRSNIRARFGERRKWKKKGKSEAVLRYWVWKRDYDSRPESQHASFALPYVSVSLRSPACADHLIHYLHDLRCLESAARKHYKTVACWFLCAPSHLHRSRRTRTTAALIYMDQQRVGV